MTIFEEMAAEADALKERMTAIRRDFHKYPEKGWEEMRTTSLIARYLTDMGYTGLKLGRSVCRDDERMGVPDEAELALCYARASQQGADPEFLPYTKGGFTGVIADLDCGDGPLLVLRFDIDALGVTEAGDPDHRPCREGFASVNEGVMHACGHDCHTAIGLAAAQILMKHRSSLSGKVRFIFQPAEEGCRGSRSIVANGWLDHADFVIGNHLAGDKEEPEFDIWPGAPRKQASATVKLDVIFKGRSAHAGKEPQKGRNALLAAAAAIQNLYAIPRSGEGYSRINAGRLTAGTGRNVIPDRAVMEMEVRGESNDINEYMYEYAVRVVKSAAEMHGCTAEIRKMGEALTMKSDPEMRELLADVCSRVNLKAAPLDKERRSSGASEDFSYMMKYVQDNGGKGVFFNTMLKCADDFHNSRIDFDEKALPNAVKVFCGAAVEVLQ